MFLFFESIKIENNTAQRIEFHQKRINNTFVNFFPKSIIFQLYEILNLDFLKNLDKNKTYKCRISYNEINFKIEILEYVERLKNIFYLIEKPELDYSFKYENRSDFDYNLQKNEELIFTQNGFITDTSYSNLIFLKDEKWFTPKTFLLNGTQRQYLLQKKLIQEMDISIDNYKQFSHFRLINAMLNFNSSIIYSTEIITFKL